MYTDIGVHALLVWAKASVSAAQVMVHYVGFDRANRLLEEIKPRRMLQNSRNLQISNITSQASPRGYVNANLNAKGDIDSRKSP